uniref:MFS domain-containing protein n=1 Tax=Meloidogyne hapla TaxID=6305 RepID=A0A1I8AYS9_MELHA
MNGQRHVGASSVPSATRKGSGATKLSGSSSAWTSQIDKNENIKIELKEVNNKTLLEENDRIDSLHIHTNPILRFIENSQLCRCSKRNQLAILANLGFLIVFGIRCNFGAAKNHMSRDFYDPWGKKHKHSFNWTSAELGVMESSFFYGYLITQIPAGFLVAIVQISQGLVQGLAYPAMHGVWRYWAPPLERSKLATTAFTGSYAGAVFGLPISAWLVSYTHWSAPFYIYGIAGVLWSIFWFSLTFERPAFHPTISAKEKEHIEASIGQVSQTQPTLSTIPWRAILTSRPVWAIIVANFARSWNFYLLLQNQLTYMRDVLGLRISDSGFIAALPHAVMGCVVLLGGRMADYLRSNKILSTTAVRKLFNCGGFGCEALFLLVVAYTRSERTAMIGLLILKGLICPFVVESLTAKGSNPNGWVTVFLLASMIHFTGITFYGVYASGELQDWAEPKEEEEKVWSAEQASEARRFEEAGKRKGSYGAVGTAVDIEPLPKIRNFSSREETTGVIQGIQQAPRNPFATDWGDSHYYQNGANNACFNEKRDSLR